MKNSIKVKYGIADMPFQPKYKVGDRVGIPVDLYGGREGVITEVQRGYQVIYDNGEFDMDGLLNLEDGLESMSVPYSFDGMTLKVKMPRADYGKWIQKAYTEVSKFYGYFYSDKVFAMGDTVDIAK